MHKLILLISLLVCLSISNAKNKNVADSMQDFYNRIGGTSNVTSAGSYSGQMSGHYPKFPTF